MTGIGEDVKEFKTTPDQASGVAQPEE